jgi:hypothetical protein
MVRARPRAVSPITEVTPIMRATKLNLSILLFFTMSIVACALHGSAQKKQEAQESPKKRWVDYWPVVVELEGKLTIKTFFGPPNFGENPETDSKERSWILSLNKPINVQGKTSTDPGLNTSVEGVRELQLVLPKPHRELISKKVIVKGTLFHAHTGHHQTDVLMDVQSISLAAPN